MPKELQSSNILQDKHKIDCNSAIDAMARIIRNYMNMVEEMLLCITYVRGGQWELHLSALHQFSKHCFTHDKLVYARMIPVYLADMDKLRERNNDIYAEFLSDNWVFNKNPSVSLCAIGDGHALEHINRSMKVVGRLTGITLNANARNYFHTLKQRRRSAVIWERRFSTRLVQRTGE